MGKWSEVFRVQPDPLSGDGKGVWVRLCLWRQLSNPAELKAAADSGSLDAALLRGELILEVFQVLAAASRALNSEARGRMVTRSLQTELIYSLSPTKNISESLGTFSIGPESQTLLAVTFDDEKGAKMSRLAKKVQGKVAPLSELSEVGDYGKVKAVYHVRDPELNKGSIIDAIASRIVTKDYAS